MQAACLVTKREQVISYPGRFVLKSFRNPGWSFHTPNLWSFRTQGLVVSYPRAGRFVPWFGHFVNKKINK